MSIDSLATFGRFKQRKEQTKLERNRSLFLPLRCPVGGVVLYITFAQFMLNFPALSSRSQDITFYFDLSLVCSVLIIHPPMSLPAFISFSRSILLGRL